MDGFNVAVVALLGIAAGVLGSHATLGNKVTRALTLLEPIPARFDSIEKRMGAVERVHYHRRSTDPMDGDEDRGG